MTAVALDTLKLARSLRDKAKLTQDQAEGFADAIADVMQADLATKGDLRGLELRLQAEIEAGKAEVVKWMFGTTGFQTVLIIGTAMALARVVRP